jgi:hypothetical protein
MLQELLLQFHPSSAQSSSPLLGGRAALSPISTAKWTARELFRRGAGGAWRCWRAIGRWNPGAGLAHEYELTCRRYAELADRAEQRMGALAALLLGLWGYY